MAALFFVDECNVMIYKEEDNYFAKLVHYAAVRGYTLRQVASGYTIASWGFVRHFGDLNDVLMTLKKMGVNPKIN